MTDNHHDAQVQAFVASLNKDRYFAFVEDCGNGEFIIDGVVNVRAALDAAMAVATDNAPLSGEILPPKRLNFEQGRPTIEHEKQS